ncbi:MAG: cell wall anchor protein [Actinomycetota bacterium]
MAPSRTDRTHLGKSARRIAAAAGVSAAFTLWAAMSAGGATLVTPPSGPATGGTTVSFAVSTLGFTQVAQGQNTGYGLNGDGHVYSWGVNTAAELGNGTTTRSLTPVLVLPGAMPTGTTITSIAAGASSGYALASDGKVYSWGANNDGQLGDGSTTTRSTPVAVDLSTLGAGVTLTQLAAGSLDAYALGSDGNIYSWGYNHDGELGNGNNTDQHTPVMVDATALPAGVHFTHVASSQNTVLAIGSDGKGYSWGSDVVGALGTGGTGDRNVPTAVLAGAIPTGVKLVQVAVGQEGGYGLGDDGHAYTWGSNMFGDLGNGNNTDSNVPVQVVAGQVPAGVKLIAIGAGSSSGYAIGDDGHAYAWGNGGNGQVGNGSTTSTTSPVLVSAGAIPADVTITSVSGGYHSAIVLGNDGKVYGWGDNGGDLADGSTTRRVTPVLGANSTVTSILFDGVAGTDLVDPPGVWTVVTPAHAAGTVSITIAGSVLGGTTGGVTTSRTLTGAFVYVAVLAATGGTIPWGMLLAGAVAILLGTLMLWRESRS